MGPSFFLREDKLSSPSLTYLHFSLFRRRGRARRTNRISTARRRKKGVPNWAMSLVWPCACLRQTEKRLITRRRLHRRGALWSYDWRFGHASEPCLFSLFYQIGTDTRSSKIERFLCSLLRASSFSLRIMFTNGNGRFLGSQRALQVNGNLDYLSSKFRNYQEWAPRTGAVSGTFSPNVPSSGTFRAAA